MQLAPGAAWATGRKGNRSPEDVGSRTWTFVSAALPNLEYVCKHHRICHDVYSICLIVKNYCRSMSGVYSLKYFLYNSYGIQLYNSNCE